MEIHYLSRIVSVAPYLCTVSGLLPADGDLSAGEEGEKLGIIRDIIVSNRQLPLF